MGEPREPSPRRRWNFFLLKLGWRTPKNDALNQLDVWRAAEILIRRYDNKALGVITARGEKLRRAGDLERYAASMQIAEIIHYLQHGKPLPLPPHRSDEAQYVRIGTWRSHLTPSLRRLLGLFRSLPLRLRFPR